MPKYRFYQTVYSTVDAKISLVKHPDGFLLRSGWALTGFEHQRLRDAGFFVEDTKDTVYNNRTLLLEAIGSVLESYGYSLKRQLAVQTQWVTTDDVWRLVRVTPANAGVKKPGWRIYFHQEGSLEQNLLSPFGDSPMRHKLFPTRAIAISEATLWNPQAAAEYANKQAQESIVWLAQPMVM